MSEEDIDRDRCGPDGNVDAKRLPSPEVVLGPDVGYNVFDHVSGRRVSSLNVPVGLLVPSDVDAVSARIRELAAGQGVDIEQGVEGDALVERMLRIAPVSALSLLKPLLRNPDKPDEPGVVPSANLYGPGGIRRWFRLCEAGSAATYRKSLLQVAALAEELVGFLDESRLTRHGVRVVELGGGDGRKLAAILGALKEKEVRKGRLDVVDTSHVAINRTLEEVLLRRNLHDLNPHAHCIPFELLDPDTIPRDHPNQSTIFDMTGMTMGNAGFIFKKVRELSQPGDVWLVDFESHGGSESQERIRSSYDSPEYREFGIEPPREIVAFRRWELYEEGKPSPNCEFSAGDVEVDWQPQLFPSVNSAAVTFVMKPEALERFQHFISATFPDDPQLARQVILHYSKKLSRGQFNIELTRAHFRSLIDHSVGLSTGDREHRYRLVAAGRK